MKKLIISIFVSIFLTGVAVNVEALVLYENIFISSGIGRNSFDPEARISANYQGISSSVVFDNATLDASDLSNIGRTFVSQNGNQGFTEFTDRLTNGIDDVWRMDMFYEGGSTSYIAGESGTFANSPFSLNSIDFEGYDINQLKWTIDNIMIGTESIEVASRFIVVGDRSVSVVPEPTTMLLFGTGMAGAALRRRRKT